MLSTYHRTCMHSTRSGAAVTSTRATRRGKRSQTCGLRNPTPSNEAIPGIIFIKVWLTGYLGYLAIQALHAVLSVLAHIPEVSAQSHVVRDRVP